MELKALAAQNVFVYAKHVWIYAGAMREEKWGRRRNRKDEEEIKMHTAGKKKKKEREIRGTKAEKASNFFTLNYQTT